MGLRQNCRTSLRTITSGGAAGSFHRSVASGVAGSAAQADGTTSHTAGGTTSRTDSTVHALSLSGEQELEVGVPDFGAPTIVDGTAYAVGGERVSRRNYQ